VAVPTFLVERYLPGMSPDGIRAGVARTRDAAETMRVEGFEIRHRATFVVAEDDLCLCRFTATSPDLVAEACRRAAFPYARILSAAPVRVPRRPTGDALPAGTPVRHLDPGRESHHA
jgi:hypothetical protein